MNKKTFKVMIDDAEVEMAVVRPNHRITQDATLVYNRSFRKAVEAGSPLKQKVEALLREQQLWDDTKQKKFEEVLKTLVGNEKKLAEGGIKLSDAKKLAIDMRVARAEYHQLLNTRDTIERTTAESFAQQALLNHLVAACTVYGDSGKAYYKDSDDFLSRENDPVGYPASQAMGSIYFGLDDNFEAKLPVNKFLAKYKFVDAELHLIRKDGKKVDSFDRLVDAQGRLVNEAGELIDGEGSLLTEEGDYKVEFKEFIDDLNEVEAPKDDETVDDDVYVAAQPPVDAAD